MEMQLDKLIERIKSDGVVNAQKQAESIIHDAEVRAKALINEAQERAKKIESEAQGRAVQSELRGRESLVQASRDLILNLEKKIRSIFDSMLGKAVTKSLNSSDTLVSLVSKIVLDMEKDGNGNYRIEVSSIILDQIKESLLSELSGTVSGGIEIYPTRAVDAGFRISEKEGKAFYDFSSQTIAENLALYVNPVLAEDIRKAAELV